MDLTFGPDGDLYVSNWNGNEMMRFDRATGSSKGVFADGGGLTNPRFNQPVGRSDHHRPLNHAC